MRKYEWGRDYKVLSSSQGCKGCILTARNCDHAPTCDYTKFFVSINMTACGRFKGEVCFTQESIADRKLELVNDKELVTGVLSISDDI